MIFLHRYLKQGHSVHNGLNVSRNVPTRKRSRIEMTAAAPKFETIFKSARKVRSVTMRTYAQRELGIVHPDLYLA
jgi:hypothetical protein